MINWHDADGKPITDHDLNLSLKDYIGSNGIIYVGTDSMLYSTNCNFASVIALYDPVLNIAKYYFKKQKLDSKIYKNLQVKIMNEVSLSLETAQYILDNYPDAVIEIHVDIGTSSKSKTRSMFSHVKGWIQGAGFDFKVKPNAWSSDIADWHTK
tara:strand:- start:3681 stop:4142 length:462 start_codon:yes stop_codon:yes gene_type:complete